MAEPIKTTKAAVKKANVKEEAKAAPETKAAVNEEVKAAPVTEETKAAPAKAEAKAAPAKEEAKKAPARKTAAKKPAAAKTTTAKTTAKAAPAKASVHFQFDGKDLIAKDILDQAIASYKKSHKDTEIKDIQLYIVANESAAYYVVNGEGGDDFKVML